MSKSFLKGVFFSSLMLLITWFGVWVFNHFPIPFVGILIIFIAWVGAIYFAIKHFSKEKE